MSRVLIYNWCPFDNMKNDGGGVTVYTRNLIEAFLCKKEPHMDIYFLSSGYKYSPFTSKPYIRRTLNKFSNSGVKTFEIINSRISAPAYTMFNKTSRFYHDTETYNLLKSFLVNEGPFDVIHFQNIEGLSLNCLDLKKDFPQLKLVFSIHNYLPICPLTQYFQNHTQKICKDFDEGRECLKCRTSAVNERKIYKAGVKRYLTDTFSSSLVQVCAYQLFRISTYLFFYRKFLPSACPTSQHYCNFRKLFIQYLNKNFDHILAVSQRVAEISAGHGIDESKLKVSYIGTKVAEIQKNCGIANSISPFVIAYLGTARIDKGFFFLLDTLEKLDKEIAKKIKVKLAVKGLDENWVNNKLEKFHSVQIIDGYTHNDLNTILNDVNLGIVPVLWEDNLPQVAIEMVAYGVPILCSDAGGASELCNSELFKFTCGNSDDFLFKLKQFVLQPEMLNHYWTYKNQLTTMDKHCDELLLLYELNER